MRRRGATEGIDQWRWCSGPYYRWRRMAVGLDGNCLVIAGVLDGRRDVDEEGLLHLSRFFISETYFMASADHIL
ncbi:hypothetical protein L1887_32243 [Cichorium endivia]|nr:hypothetical protein L1887_32243 [Cichorium endivia]